MTERMNPPALGLKLIAALESSKQDLGIRLKNREDASPIWNEYVFSYAIEFCKIFHDHYAKFPDFSDRAIEAARHNAAVETIDVLKRQIYNFKTLQPSYEKKILGMLDDHIRRDRPQPIAWPIASNAPNVPAMGIGTETPLLKMAMTAKPLTVPDPVASQRQAFVQPLLDDKGWSLFDWAKAAKVSHHTASNYVNNKRKTQPYNLKKLANALGHSYQQFPR